MSNLKVHFSSKSDEWETPKDLFDNLNNEFKFNLDAAATKENALCLNYFTKEDDALIKDLSIYKSIFFKSPVWSYDWQICQKSLRRIIERMYCCLFNSKQNGYKMVS